MKPAKTLRYILLYMTAIFVLSGCAYPISRQLRESARDIKLPAVVENPAAHKGAVVIWGGKIIKTFTSDAGSDIYILGMPLNYQERPVDRQVTDGRFVARTKQYLDPALYEAGKSITVAGTVEGVEKHLVGERQYPYPVVHIREIHLWKPETTYVYPGWYGWDPYGYGPPYIGPRYYYYEPGFRFDSWEHREMHEKKRLEMHPERKGKEHDDRK